MSQITYQFIPVNLLIEFSLSLLYTHNIVDSYLCSPYDISIIVVFFANVSLCCVHVLLMIANNGVKRNPVWQK